MTMEKRRTEQEMLDEKPQADAKCHPLLDQAMALWIQGRAHREAIDALHGIISARQGQMPKLSEEERERLEKAMARVQAAPEVEQPSEAHLDV